MSIRRWCVIVILLSGFFFVSGIGTLSRAVNKTGPEKEAVIEKKAEKQMKEPAEEPSPDVRTIKGTVEKGDTASGILDDHLPLKTVYDISRKSRKVFPLHRLNRGHIYRITLEEGTFASFEYEIDREEKLVVCREKEEFSITRKPIEYDCDVKVISGTIEASLFSAVQKAGEGIEIAIRLSEIFAWDIDFIRDIRPGDRFRVLVKKRYKNGNPAGYERVLAAFFTNRGNQYKAFYHENKDGRAGYYDENGDSMQKKFLKAPLSFSRISSKYSNSRLHPIFKEYRPHRGVDYAAPEGTPIKAVGAGTVTAFGYNKSMGNYISVRHPNGFKTGYNHMSRFAEGMKRNKEVEQGEVIGYVGATGYATGPHLDFRMKKRNKPIDPLKYESPPANPINPEEMERFRAEISRFSERILTASSDTPSDREST
ncbi:MAG: peptidoglycan DD-metalloendopeptidase family protein [Desulfarculaceae bacterium]|nr:peptidoglycan DD-metalloendopeptidase family protein [Desulfarculaceae bacterium]